MSVLPAPDRTQRPSADATRDALVAAAIELFSERSFVGATTRQIAARAGVAQALLTYHFRSKDALWHAAVDSLFDRLESTMNARLAGLRGVDEVASARLLVHEFVMFSAYHPQLHRILTQESKTDGPHVDHVVARIRPLYERAVDLFDRLARAGAVPDIPASHLYYILTGAGPTMFVLAPECRQLTGLDPTADDVIATHADAVCRLLFGS